MRGLSFGADGESVHPSANRYQTTNQGRPARAGVGGGAGTRPTARRRASTGLVPSPRFRVGRGADGLPAGRENAAATVGTGCRRPVKSGHRGLRPHPLCLDAEPMPRNSAQEAAVASPVGPPAPRVTQRPRARVEPHGRVQRQLVATTSTDERQHHSQARPEGAHHRDLRHRGDPRRPVARSATTARR